MADTEDVPMMPALNVAPSAARRCRLTAATAKFTTGVFTALVPEAALTSSNSSPTDISPKRTQGGTTRNGIHLLALGHATSLFLAITSTVCVAFDPAFPDMTMYESGRRLLPGFEWLSWKSYFIGLIESYGYGWYIALVWAPLYNFFGPRQRS